MHLPHQDVERLIGEHHTLLQHYGKTQTRCSELARAQAAEIQALQAQLIQLRAAVIVRDSALAWAAQDRAALEAALPGLPRRRALARRVEALMARVQELMRERLRAPRRTPAPARAALAAPVQAVADTARPWPLKEEDLCGLEASLVAADLVICQTGCLSHGAYWRVQDHCRRTGKTCVLVEQPDALRIMRITPPQDGAPTAAAPELTSGR